MSLRAQAALDVRSVLEDLDGFACSITVTDPWGTSAVLTGLAQDISRTIDPDTGLLVAGRLASVTLPLVALFEAGLEEPRGVAESTELPWRVKFADVQGTVRAFKIARTSPDHEAGIIVCELEGLEE